jgi:histidine ammonia-lyase
MNSPVNAVPRAAEPVVVEPGLVSLATLAEIYWHQPPVAVHRDAQAAVAKAAQQVLAAAQADAPVYGVNTGFGKLAAVKIPAADTARLQRNLIRSHCAGVGEPLSARVVRLVIALKLISLGRGASGVRWCVIEQLEALLHHNIHPVVPGQGSVGASGDLAPLAHIAAVLMGEGEAVVAGTRMSGADALASAGIAPIELAAKEGLALINGTQVSTALALAGLFETWRCARGAIITSALSTEAIMGSTAPLRAEIHALRGHAGQIDVAHALRTLIDGSEIRDSHLEGDERVQDPYCIRCQPQVAGACLDLLRNVAATLTIEANAVTDNPLVLTEAEVIVSGGNFHAEPVAFAADQTALAIAELGAIAQRRVAMMVDPTLNFGLPPFLTPDAGLNSGLMIAEVSSAALMSENKHLAAPCSVDSTPTSANQEDHVSMACHAARRLGPMTDNLGRILGVELLCATAGIGFRRPLRTSPVLEQVLALFHSHVAPIDVDRPYAPDIEIAATLIRNDAINIRAADDALPKLVR